MPEKKLNVGGQAVLEGVMMRSPKCFAVAVRRKSGEIVLREEPWRSTWASKLGKVPFVRGSVTLFESLRNGYSALRFSADQMEEDIADEEASAAAARGEPAPAASSSSSGAGTRLAFVFAILLFIALPQWLASGAGRLFGRGLTMQTFGFHALTGLFKLSIVLGYLILIRRVPDILRVFQYHGAEHKVIATYESGEELTVENARRHSTRHARCGTTFLIVVVMVSVLAYAAILPPILRLITLPWAAEQALAITLKVFMLPLIAGVAYELQRLGARFSTHPIARLMLTPGYWVQGITTAEPTEQQLEVALVSLRVTLLREAEAASRTSVEVQETVVSRFPSFSTFVESFGTLGARQPV